MSRVELELTEFRAVAQFCCVCDLLATWRGYDAGFCDEHSNEEHDTEKPHAEVIRDVQAKIYASYPEKWVLTVGTTETFDGRVWPTEAAAQAWAAQALQPGSYKVVKL